MKVLFLIQGYSVAASRYRVLQYIPYLKSKGIETTISLYPRTVKENIRFFYSLPQYNIVFLQRKRFNQPGWNCSGEGRNELFMTSMMR